MTVHNGQRFLAESLQSILGQDFTDFELVVGEDGSTDGTAEILEEFAQRDGRIRVLSRFSKSGLANATNWVVGQARAEIVAVTHADDICYHDRLSRQLAAFKAMPCAVMVGGPSVGLDARGRIIHPANLWRLLQPGVMAPFAHSSIMFRQSAFKAAGQYRPAADYWEDLDLHWRMARLGRILILTGPVTGYRYSDDSVRSRDQTALVEQAVQRMYERASAIVKNGSEVALSQPPTTTARKLRPRVFVARAWVDVWNGRRTRLLPRMLLKAELRADWSTLEALVFLTLATASPRLLRLALRTIVHVRNWIAIRRFEGSTYLEWVPF